MRLKLEIRSSGTPTTPSQNHSINTRREGEKRATDWAWSGNPTSLLVFGNRFTEELVLTQVGAGKVKLDLLEDTLLQICRFIGRSILFRDGFGGWRCVFCRCCCCRAVGF